MSWLSTVFTAIATAAVGTVVSGYFANLAVRWYRISGFEGGSGYFVVGLAICGLVAGLLVGLIVSRIVAASANPSILLALLYSAAAMLTVTGVAGGVARLVADIPPTIDGETLLLQVEARWPITRTESPANTPGVAYLDLGSITLLRKQEPKRGPLWKEDAQKVDGNWTVLGVAPMFTSRGTPLIDIALNDSEHTSFTLPSLSHPTTDDFAWSSWYPTDGRGGPVRTSGVTYRYRVRKQSVPVRTEIVGDFAVSAVVSYFMPVATDGMSTIDFYGTFRMTPREKVGVAVPDSNSLSSGLEAQFVAILPGVMSTLLAALTPRNGGSYWALVTSENGSLRTQRIANYESATLPAELTNSAERMAEARRPPTPRGRVDNLSYSHSKMLLFDHAVLNVDTHEIHPYTAQSKASMTPSVPPLGVSPDAHSFVRFGMGEVDNRGEYAPLLIVTDFIRDTVYELPIDRSRMRYGVLDDLTTVWLTHHFAWKRVANGSDRLEVRTDFVPVPYHGDVLTDTNGQSVYSFGSGGQPVRQALCDFLKSEFQATGDTSNENEHSWMLHIGRDSISVETPGEKSTYVRLSLNGNATASTLVVRIAKAFNAALGTGKYDKAFEQP